MHVCIVCLSAIAEDKDRLYFSLQDDAESSGSPIFPGVPGHRGLEGAQVKVKGHGKIPVVRLN